MSSHSCGNAMGSQGGSGGGSGPGLGWVGHCIVLPILVGMLSGS
jgi:hypothetical protein